MPMKLSSYINSFSYKEDPNRVSNWTERLKKAQPNLFDFDYPIYDNEESPMSKEEIKDGIELGIMRHYYKREIGGSGGTIADFKHDLEEWLNRRMPYYNELFYTLTFKYNLTDNTNITEVFTREVDDILDEGVKRNETIDNDKVVNSKENINNNVDEKGSNTNTNNFRGIELDTPQGSQNIDDMSFKHASGGTITKDTDSGSDTKNTVSKGITDLDKTDKTKIKSDMVNDKKQTKNKVETYTKKRDGKIGIGSYPKLIADYRKNIINIIEEIILEADDCFYQLYEF